MSSHCSSSIIGTGSYMPARVLTNDDLAKIVDTSDEWITSRTGIRQRRIAAENETTSDMAAAAARNALHMAGVSAEELDLIVVATVTPDMFFPSTACFVQSKIGAKKAAGFDVSAACSGFLYALQTTHCKRRATF
jgi:3-oxoacyl-[acyl-carrier-protein] synthase III